MATAGSSNRTNRVGMEENILAILDATDSKHTQDAHDDRIAFLEAVRADSIVPDNGAAPTNKMYEAVFGIMRDGKSLELIMESYRLLIELDKRFPRVYVLNRVSEPSELVVDEEAWSPFVFNLDIASSEREAAGKSFGLLEVSCFHLLIQNLTELVNDTKIEALTIKSLGNMLLFQYLVNVLEADFVPRKRVYDEIMNWTLLKESFLNMLLSSRRINYKSLMKDCLSIMCKLYQVSAGNNDDLESSDNAVIKPSQYGNLALAMALLEIANSSCTAMQKLFTMIMELDVLRKKADTQGCTTRADGVRTPLVEIILDELNYDRGMLLPFLQTFRESKWKLEIILQYFSKYIAKPSVRTRRSNGSAEDTTFNGVLKFFSNINSTKNITKKIGTDVVQILLAYAFQAHLSSQQDAEEIHDSEDELGGSFLIDICENIISAFSSLRRTHEKMEILPLGKEAIFTAATILSTKA